MSVLIYLSALAASFSLSRSEPNYFRCQKIRQTGQTVRGRTKFHEILRTWCTILMSHWWICTTLLLLLQAELARGEVCDHILEKNVGQRSYFLFVPQYFCDNPLEIGPVILAFHCFGCDAEMEMGKYIDLSIEFKFILASPVGIGSIPCFSFAFDLTD